MKAVINQLIDDFHERELPALIPRDRKFAEIKGKADADIGMRRSGKTWFRYQKMTELSVATGTIVTWDEEMELDGGIDMVPAWKWLLR